MDSPERAAGLRADGPAAETADRSVAGEERNQLLPEQRGQERSPGQAEEEEGERRAAGKLAHLNLPAASIQAECFIAC